MQLHRRYVRLGGLGDGGIHVVRLHGLEQIVDGALNLHILGQQHLGA